MLALFRRLQPLALPALLIVLATFAVYLPGIRGGFIFDDFANLVHAPDWKVTRPEAAQWWRAMREGIASSFGRPLAMLSFAINHYFTGMDPAPMKLTGIALHTVNAVLVLCLCTQLFRLARGIGNGERTVHWAALFCALAWALHPLQVSSVLYVVQRMEVGAHTGVLIALLSYLRARHHQLAGERAWPWFGLAGMGTLFGLGFKESAILVPVYTLAIELCLLGFRGASDKRSAGIITLYIVSGSAALLVFISHVLPGAMGPGAYAFRDFTLYERLLTQAPVLAMYLTQMFYPVPGSLHFYYDNFPVSTSLLHPRTTLASLMLLIALAAGALLARHRWPLLALGTAWFFCAHALTSNVIPLELAFEHRNYFALLGVVIALAPPIAELGNRLHADARRTLATLLIIFLAALCVIQVRTWSEPLRLAAALANRNPESVRASYDLGRTLLEAAGSNRESPAYHLAIRQLEHASRLPSSNPLPEQALLIIHARTGDEASPELWDRMRQKLQMRRAGPQEAGALHGLIDCRRRPDCQLDDQQLLDTLLTAIIANPHSAILHSLYGGFAFNFIQDRELGIRLMTRATELQPHNLQFKVNLARFLVADGSHQQRLASLMDEIRRLDTHGIYQNELESGFLSLPKQGETPGT